MGFSACSDIGTGTITPTIVCMHVGEFMDTLLSMFVLLGDVPNP